MKQNKNYEHVAITGYKFIDNNKVELTLTDGTIKIIDKSDVVIDEPQEIKVNSEV